MPVKFNSRCNEKFNGYPSPVLTIERERQPSQHCEPLPVYQQLSQNHQHLQQHPQHQRLTMTSGAGQKVPDYENHQIAPNFHQQYQAHRHANYSPKNRITATAAAVTVPAIVANHSYNNNLNNNNLNNNNNNKPLVMGHASPVAIARFGELTSSSFEHVNVTNFLPDMIGSEKQYRSTSNFTNERDLMDERQMKSMSARRRAVPPIPVQPSPNQTVSRYQFYSARNLYLMPCPRGMCGYRIPVLFDCVLLVKTRNHSFALTISFSIKLKIENYLILNGRFEKVIALGHNLSTGTSTWPAGPNGAHRLFAQQI